MVEILAFRRVLGCGKMVVCQATGVGRTRYRKAVLVGPVGLCVRDLLCAIAMEPELHIISGKVAREHIHLLIAHRSHQSVRQILQWL